MNLTLPQKLLSVQKKIAPLTKDSNNPFFKSKYADLNQVLDVAKSALHNEGLFIVQGAGLNEFGRYVETSIIDSESGQQINCKVPFSGSEKNMQEIGAAITYGRRFGLVSLLALEQEDDDGETAVGRSYANSATAGKAAPQPKPAAQAPVKKDTPVGITLSKSSSRKGLNEKISLTGEILIETKRSSANEIVDLLKSYKVSSKEELSDEQAKDLLTKLEEKLNAK